MAIRNEFGLTQKEIEIGDWNMDTTAILQIPHGLSGTEWRTIRNINVIIRNDADSGYDPINRLTSTAGQSAGSIGQTTGVNFSLLRVAAQSFDNSTYSATTFNRGFINFDYVAD